jgi:hypothetical protein
VTKLTDSGRTPITSSTNLLKIERRSPEIKMRSIDLETLLLSRKENAKIMMPRSRASITISTKPKRKLKSSQNLPMLKISSAEEPPRLLTPLVPSSPEPKMITRDLWLSLKPFKEILMDN